MICVASKDVYSNCSLLSNVISLWALWASWDRWLNPWRQHFSAHALRGLAWSRAKCHQLSIPGLNPTSLCRIGWLSLWQQTDELQAKDLYWCLDYWSTINRENFCWEPESRVVQQLQMDLTIALQAGREPGRLESVDLRSWFWKEHVNCMQVYFEVFHYDFCIL